MTVNRLAAAPSAYLKSAAHQPIHWYPWGDEAFAAARSQDRPVLLDIGAVWCHWCHVMDGESYENPALAEFLNQHFVCIKVDRDERPDVDARYQRAMQALTRQGGWPLTAFLTPAGEVFYGGTYFPPDGMHGRPGFRTVLESVLDAYRSRRGQVMSQAEAVRRVVADDLDEAAAGEPVLALLDDAVPQMARVLDPVNGGFGQRTQVSPPRRHDAAAASLVRTSPASRRADILDRTLHGMARGGVYDHLGGGFHRYSVDAEWIVPHFEKMSYDNSELLKVYLDAYAVFGIEEYARAARGIVRWVRETGSDPEGGYAASQDADVGLDDDGDYFTWTRDEAAAALSAGGARGRRGVLRHRHRGRDASQPGEERAVRRRPRWRSSPAAWPQPPDDIRATLERATAKLLAARSARPAPFVDRTRYANWNAMMASAMLRAGAVLGDDDARRHAILTLERLRRERVADDAVAHTPGGVTGLLDDQVQVAAAALDAYEATGEAGWLDLVGAAHGPRLDRLLGRGQGRAVRHRPGARRRARPAAGAGQAGAGCADAVAERRRRHRLRPPARAHR